MNATELFANRLTDMRERKNFSDEVATVVEQKTFMKLYQSATKAPKSFLSVKFTARDRHERFSELVHIISVHYAFFRRTAFASR